MMIPLQIAILTTAAGGQRQIVLVLFEIQIQNLSIEKVKKSCIIHHHAFIQLLTSQRKMLKSPKATSASLLDVADLLLSTKSKELNERDTQTLRDSHTLLNFRDTNFLGM